MQLQLCRFLIPSTFLPFDFEVSVVELVASSSQYFCCDELVPALVLILAFLRALLLSSYRSIRLTLASLSFSRLTTMEYHFVPQEERARDDKGNLLPWGYVYKE